MEKFPRASQEQPEDESEAKDKDQPKMSRREFFKVGALLGGTVALADLQASRPQITSETEVNILERRKNITSLETNRGMYRIEYGNHNQLSTPEVLEGVDALILEVIGDYASSKEAAIETLNAIGYDTSPIFHPYTALIPEALRQGKPIYFVDIVNSVAFANQTQSFGNAEITRTLEGMVGGLLGVAGLDAVDEMHKKDSQSSKNEETLSRRNLLKKALKTGVVGASGYLLSGTPMQAADLVASNFHTKTPDESDPMRQAQKSLTHVERVLHPELRSGIIDTRNVLIAQKSETIAQMLGKELGRKPLIAVEVGAGHYEIENELRASENDRLVSLEKDLGPGLDDESLIVRLELVKSEDGVESIKTTTYTDPGMRALAEEKGLVW